MESGSNRILDMTIIDDPREFEALERKWDDLYHHAPLATPFQSWAWLYSWWEFYGEARELRIIAIRSQSLLVGLVPLMLERRWGLGRLSFIGAPASDYLDALVREGWEEEFYEAAAWSLHDMSSWHVADLQELRPSAAVWGIFQRWDHPRTQLRQSSCPVVAVKSWEELLTPLSKNLRKTIRRSIRRVEEDGVHCELAGSDDIERAARRWIALHRESWQGRDIVQENLTQRFELHLRTATRRMTEHGLGAIAEFWREGEVVISIFFVFGKDFVGSYLLGASHEALDRYQASSLYIWNGVNLAQKRNVPYLDLMRGIEPYKLRWNPKIVVNQRILLGRSQVFWFPYVSYWTLRLKARDLADSETTPRWIRSLLNRMRRN